MRPALAALVVAAALAPSAAAQPAIMPGPALARPVTVPLVPFAGARRSVEVVVAGDTLAFLFDTAGGVTAISPVLAARLGCTPRGRYVGYRMTGEPIRNPTCEGVALEVGGVRVTTSAIVYDLAGAFGPDAPALDGIVSLATLGHLPLTLDLARNALTVETARSLAARTRTMSPLHVRLATGPGGAELTPHLAADVAGTTLWFMFDSGHVGPAFVAPHAARLLGLADTTGAADAALAFGARLRVALPVQGKPDLIHDGVLGAPVLERAVWTIDLARSRMWAGPVAPLFAPPPSGASAADVAGPAGWYDAVLVDRGSRQPVVLHVARGPAGLTGRLRFVGDDRVFDLADVRAEGATLAFGLPMRQTYPVRLTFDGLRGAGTWGDPAGRGGAFEATRRE